MGLFSNMMALYDYSECDDGFFGPNCIEKCNTTCRNCNKTSGICDKGCKPGWKGLYCQDGILCNCCLYTPNGKFNWSHFQNCYHTMKMPNDECSLKDNY